MTTDTQLPGDEPEEYEISHMNNKDQQVISDRNWLDDYVDDCFDIDPPWFVKGLIYVLGGVCYVFIWSYEQITKLLRWVFCKHAVAH